ncbi:hypothetical protein ACFL49_02850 [Candidatus Omnitrophota bacterium]
MKKFCEQKNKRGQSMIEFTFSLVVFSFMMYAAAKFAFWLGPDLATRSIIYDELMDGKINIDYDVPLTPFSGAVVGD